MSISNASDSTSPRSPALRRVVKAARRLVERLAAGARQISVGFTHQPLQRRFLIAATLIVALAMYALGNILAFELETSMVTGVASSMAAGTDALLSDDLMGFGGTGPLSPADKADLDAMFSIASDIDGPKLLQVRIFDMSGNTIYQSLGGLLDPSGSGTEIATAMQGRTSSRFARFALASIGPLAAEPVDALKVVTPLHRPADHAVFAVAELFYGGATLLERERTAFWAIWIAVGGIGLLVLGAFYLLVDRAARVIASQRQRLAGNLERARGLARQNRALTAASEQLRHEASLANEQLLAQVGTELHDGPLQLLTLLIMQLGRTTQQGGRDGNDANVRLAGQAMEELRNISTGLVLPELEPVSLADTVIMAVARHQQLTANNVTCDVGPLPGAVGTDVKICVYRLLQEALTNAYLHGEPGARVSVEATEGALMLSVVNTPSRSTPDAGSRRARLGLRGMRFRVESLGGRLDLANKDGRTVVLSAVLPLDQATAEPAAAEPCEDTGY